jgi:DNA polymerase elongation subunit (family B)
MNIDDIKKSILVFDIETSSQYPDGSYIDISSDFDNYVKYARVKWFGCYSYKYNKYYNVKVAGNEKYIRDFIEEHEWLCGFNNEEFDTPIMQNNYLIPDGYVKQIDCKTILGNSSYVNRNGFKNKGRGVLMGYKFIKNSLKHIAEVMGLETQKGDIDYKIFYKDEWTPEEEKEIITYLQADVEVTKQMLDKLWEYWEPFTDFLAYKDIINLSWIRSSISSLTYKAACNILGVEDTYSEDKTVSEKMGGRVIEPKYEEARNVWYVDFTSLYPNITAMFNLLNEVPKGTPGAWHGNDVFKVKGYYDIKNRNPICADIVNKLKTRIRIKREDPNNPMQYAIKIFLNSLYGAARSPVFERIHCENYGYDTCWLGQQFQIITEKMMGEMGFETIAGDTDSIFVVARDEKNNNEEYVKQCLKKVVDFINASVPFPNDVFNIDIDAKIDYAMWYFVPQPVVDENGKTVKKGNRVVRELRALKKNYLYIEGEKIKLMGFPIKKDNATELGKKIYKEKILPLIKEKRCGKFPKEFIYSTIDEYVNNPENLKYFAVFKKCKPLKSYKNESQLEAQLSKNYFNGDGGYGEFIKNKKIGKAGKAWKYCTVDEALEYGLKPSDCDTSKIYKELEPFIKKKND